MSGVGGTGSGAAEAAGAGPPAEVTGLVVRRAAARAEKDFATSDGLREEVRSLGWVVADGPDGQTLSPAPPFPTVAAVGAVLGATPVEVSRLVGVGLVVDGWPQDVRETVTAWVEHTSATVVGLDLGDVDGAGRVLAEVAAAHPGRVEHHHLERPCGWGEAREALLRLDGSEVHVVADLSSVPTGDALAPLLAALRERPDASVATWRGVDAAADWQSFVDAGPGEVDAALGYLFAVRRADALLVGPPRKARYYRNADMEWSFLLREGLRADGRGGVVVPEGELPVRQGRHHGYADTGPELRERESRKNYSRFLGRFRGRDDLRATRGQGQAGATSASSRPIPSSRSASDRA